MFLQGRQTKYNLTYEELSQRLNRLPDNSTEGKLAYLQEHYGVRLRFGGDITYGKFFARSTECCEELWAARCRAAENNGRESPPEPDHDKKLEYYQGRYLIAFQPEQQDQVVDEETQKTMELNFFLTMLRELGPDCARPYLERLNMQAKNTKDQLRKYLQKISLYPEPELKQESRATGYQCFADTEAIDRFVQDFKSNASDALAHEIAIYLLLQVWQCTKDLPLIEVAQKIAASSSSPQPAATPDSAREAKPASATVATNASGTTRRGWFIGLFSSSGDKREGVSLASAPAAAIAPPPPQAETQTQSLPEQHREVLYVEGAAKEVFESEQVLPLAMDGVTELTCLERINVAYTPKDHAQGALHLDGINFSGDVGDVLSQYINQIFPEIPDEFRTQLLLVATVFYEAFPVDDPLVAEKMAIREQALKHFIRELSCINTETLNFHLALRAHLGHIYSSHSLNTVEHIVDRFAAGVGEAERVRLHQLLRESLSTAVGDHINLRVFHECCTFCPVQVSGSQPNEDAKAEAGTDEGASEATRGFQSNVYDTVWSVRPAVGLVRQRSDKDHSEQYTDESEQDERKRQKSLWVIVRSEHDEYDGFNVKDTHVGTHRQFSPSDIQLDYQGIGAVLAWIDTGMESVLQYSYAREAASYASSAAAAVAAALSPRW